MTVLIDTSVWSITLRRRPRDLNPAERAVLFQWQDLLRNGDAALLGPILQEILSGISDPHVYESLAAQLESVIELPLDRSTWLLAAEYFNLCRASGIAPGSIDMAICAAAHLGALPIFTMDPDFTQYARVLPIALYDPSKP